jgi:LAO/AO transport system kinase
MQTLGLDEASFIRSMATRGNLGGLARATVDAVAILDAAGYAKIIVETVGVGQDEVEVVKAADVSVVVLVPAWATTFRRSSRNHGDRRHLRINKSKRRGLRDRKGARIAPVAGISATMVGPADREKLSPLRTTAWPTSRRQSPVFQKHSSGLACSSERRRAIARWRIVELLRENLLSARFGNRCFGCYA